MTRLFLAAGVAALAITAPAASAPADDRGKDRGAQAQKAERGSKARAQRTERKQAVKQRSSARQQRAQRPERRQAVQQRSNVREQRAQRTERRQAVERRAQTQERRAQSQERRVQRPTQVREQRANRVQNVRDQRADRIQRPSARERIVERRANVNDSLRQRQNRQLERIAERRGFQLDRVTERRDRQLTRLAERNVIRASDWNELARGGVWLNGCPPGLAKKPVACVPPGQVKNLVGQPLRVLSDRVALQTLPNRLRFVYRDTPDYYYRYGNGYMYRVNRRNDLVSALLPLFGLGLTAGQQFPAAYSNYYLPTGLRPFYASSSCGSPFGNNDYYRYASGYVYEIDCRTGLIEDVDPMLGYGYGYGQMMPLTYSAYNVPYQYRPLYFDTSDAYYRYAPGAIYQVDPTTSLITAVAALLTGGLTVGQPLPLGYSAYNVPLTHRTTYYDTPNAMYRYANGSIYRVDPSTQLVTALVASALT